MILCYFTEFQPKSDMFDDVSLSEFLLQSEDDFKVLCHSNTSEISEELLNFTDIGFEGLFSSEIKVGAEDESEFTTFSSDLVSSKEAIASGGIVNSISSTNELTKITVKQEKSFYVKKQKITRYPRFKTKGQEIHYKIEVMHRNELEIASWVQNALKNIFLEIQSYKFSHCGIYIADRYLKNTERNAVFVRKEKFELSDLSTAFMQKLTRSLKPYFILTVICHFIDISKQKKKDIQS